MCDEVYIHYCYIRALYKSVIPSEMSEKCRILLTIPTSQKILIIFFSLYAAEVPLDELGAFSRSINGSVRIPKFGTVILHTYRHSKSR